MQIPFDDSLKLLLSVVAGSLIGIEREYSSKAAGFRTMTLICVGATIFTILSIKIGGSNADRIAANIISGIGFIGAGIIFKDSLSISGITTAAAIWATAALGMAIGSGYFLLAGEGLFLVLVVLLGFEIIQKRIDKFHQIRSYKIVLENINDESALLDILKELNLRYDKKREIKSKEDIVVFYTVYGSRIKNDQFNNFLLNQKLVKSFDWSFS